MARAIALRAKPPTAGIAGITAAIVAIAGVAGVSPVQVVKRTAIPMAVAAIINIVFIFINSY